MPQRHDPLEPVIQCINAGVTIEELAARSHVNPMLIQHWLNNGVPAQVSAWYKRELPIQVETFRRLIETAEAILNE